jgi:fructuronate reductase
LAANGERARKVVLALSAAVDPALHDWIATNVTFPGTMVDRITPRTTDDDQQVVLERTGWVDESPVVAEPFSDWVIEDNFPHGRPAWDLVGARFVADVQPFEQRKLLLLNGGHSLLAYLGLLRGWSTIAEAVADPRCREALDEWWSECAPLLAFGAEEIDDYRASLLDRWSNPRIRHLLAQIATDGSQKLGMRAAPVLRWHAGAGSSAPVAELVFGAWLANVRARGSGIQDVDPTITELADADLDIAIARLVERFLPELADDEAVAAGIRSAYQSCMVPSVSRLTGR